MPGNANRAAEVARGVAHALDDISQISPQTTTKQLSAASTSGVVSALEQFQECIRYLNTRRSKGAIIDINAEDDVQDVLFLMLRPWVPDLLPENPTDRSASRYVIKDFLSKQLKTVIEAKFIRDKKHGKDISKELHDDIEMYRNHPDCLEIVFFIYDPDSLVPDAAGLKKQIQGVRNYDGRSLRVSCLVKP